MGTIKIKGDEIKCVVVLNGAVNMKNTQYRGTRFISSEM